MDALFVEVSYRDATGGYFLGTDEAVETDYETVGEVFRACTGRRIALGRCTGKVYVDTPEGEARQVGWVFISRQPYDDDASKSYLREAWVVVKQAPDDVTVKRVEHFADFA